MRKHAVQRDGPQPTNALDSLRDEIRYRLELCPCTTVNDDYVELNVVSCALTPPGPLPSSGSPRKS
jgi:hypothetical protein